MTPKSDLDYENRGDKCRAYYRPVLYAHSADRQEVLLYQPGCGQWECLFCAARLRAYWVKRIAAGYDQYSGCGMQFDTLTLTMHEKLYNAWGTLRALPGCWSKLSTRARRAGLLRYVAIPEPHPSSGRVHLHLLINRMWTREAWVKNARSSGWGYQVKLRGVYDHRGAISYAAKHLGKCLSSGDWPKGFRRVRTSQHWPECPDDFEKDTSLGEWVWLCSYPVDGLEFLAQGLAEKWRIKVSVLR